MKLSLSRLSAAAWISVVLLTVSMAQQTAEPPPSPPAPAQNASSAVVKPGPVASPKNAVTPRNEPRGIVVDPSGVHIGDERGIDISMGPAGGKAGGFAQFIGLVAILAPFLTLFAIFAIVLYFRHRRRVILHETLRAMIEKGQPIPPELIAGGVDARNGSRRRSAYGDLRGGLVLVAAGAALFYLHGKWGLIPLAIGIALLIVSAVERWEKGKQGTNP